METYKNKFPIFTNNLKIEIDRNKVCENFTIFQIGTENSFFKNNVLDIADEKFKAQSTAYYRNNRWFAMFKSGKVSFGDFKNEVQSIDDSAIINEVNLFDSDENSITNIKDVELAQLLVNTLKNRAADSFSYNNLTGSLYYSNSSNKNAKTFELLKLRFFTTSKDNIALEANFETFSDYETLKKYGKKAEPKYVFDDKTGEFRRKLNEDYGKNARFFDKGALSRKGKRKKFLDFSNNDNFLKSKSGMIATFFDDVKENLGEYISIEQIPIFDYTSYDSKSEDYENKDYKSFLQKQKMCVVDTVDTPESRQMKNQIVQFLQTEYGISGISDTRQKNAYIIEIIHDKDSDFYAKKEEILSPNLFEEMNKPQDQHNLYTEEEIIQHITVENSAEKIDGESIKHLMHNVVQELIIKADLHKKQISLVNWNENDTWTFVKCGTGKWNNAKSCNEYTYYKMEISDLGKIHIESFNSSKFPSDDWEAIDSIFQKYNHNNKYSPVECIVYKDISEINVIYKTKQFTLPNIEKLSETLSLSAPNKTANKALIKNAIEEYRSATKVTESLKNAFEIMLANLEKDASSTITIKHLLEYVDTDGEKKKIRIVTIKPFIKFLFEATKESENPILLHSEPKSQENSNKYLNSLFGVKSVQLDETFKYFVGAKNKDALHSSVPCSCIIRDVIPWNQDGGNPNGKILFDEFAHMLTVEFVRNGQYTATPFPIKYLNEHIRFCEKDEDFGQEID